jgi:ABC-type dipeptide/oligopeptide/nickel transport system ATPase component
LKKTILKINNLSIFPKINSDLKLVKNISFDLPEGKTTCIVGESGSGKSLTALSIIKLLSSQLSLTGDIFFKNKNLSTITNNEMRLLRGKEISMIFQEPMTSLNPVLTIGFQIEESILVHNKLSKNQSRKRTEDLLELVGIDPDRYNSFPDELSGGQRQRVMIAMAMSCDPSLLIADEPTTALDVTVQAQVLKLLNSLKKKKQMTLLFITHDFGVVNDIADEVIVMFQGNIVEQGSVDKVLKNPMHPYTKALMRCVPDIHGRKKIQPIDYRKLKKEMASL